ncbi:uncharacterized protein LOC110704958 [Chenopodium quinoa]|uniref:uncharacterized protein LOC110704958 n=1 Tax=Chenopodium quinoa TaxID=63459 RepID=UPI000B797D14|nr:uncharacterized protein LOC110704958 [Chenopodium quinoa]
MITPNYNKNKTSFIFVLGSLQFRDMDRVSFKLVAFAFLAFMLCTATTPVVGRATKSSTEELALAMEYKMIPEKMATSRVEPSIHQTNLGNQKTKMMNSQRIVDVLESYMKKDLQCVGAGRGCNIYFGPSCCSFPLACLPPGIFGGVCVG